MEVIDQFLQEDMLVIRPSIFFYVDKKAAQQVIDNGVTLDKDYISCYLKRIPQLPAYQAFLDNNYPVRLTLKKLQKIRDQKVKLKPVNISQGLQTDEEISLKDEGRITALQQKYDSYLNTCYNDSIPLEHIPHIDLYLSGRFLPGFVCKVLFT